MNTEVYNKNMDELFKGQCVERIIREPDTKKSTLHDSIYVISRRGKWAKLIWGDKSKQRLIF